MEKQQEIYDTITAMSKYSFQKPINVTVIIEDNENESKISDCGKNHLICTNLQEKYQYINCTMQDKNACTMQDENACTSRINKQKNRTDISPSQIFSGKGNKRKLDGFQSYIPNSNVTNTSPCTENSPSCIGIVDQNNSSKAPVSYYPQKKETVLIQTISENLALIMENYVHYCTLISKSKEQQYIIYLKAECMRIKLNLFNKCIKVSKDFLLQHENNNRFIEKVLYRVKQISKVTLPIKHIVYLYGDLVKWIRHKTIENTGNNNQNIKHKNLSASTFVSKPIADNRSATNIFSSGPPGNQVTISIDPKIVEQQRLSQNVTNPTTTHLSCLQSNFSNLHYSPYSNYSSIGENNQTTVPNAPARLNSINHNERQLTQFPQYNNCNNRYAAIDQVDSEDITRSSISRDSGFISPVMYSPTEYYINSGHYSSAEYEQLRTLNFETPNVTIFDPSADIEGPHF